MTAVPPNHTLRHHVRNHALIGSNLMVGCATAESLAAFVYLRLGITSMWYLQLLFLGAGALLAPFQACWVNGWEGGSWAEGVFYFVVLLGFGVANAIIGEPGLAYGMAAALLAVGGMGSVISKQSGWVMVLGVWQLLVAVGLALISAGIAIYLADLMLIGWIVRIAALALWALAYRARGGYLTIQTDY
jgi:hypothetical protein